MHHWLDSFRRQIDINSEHIRRQLRHNLVFHASDTSGGSHAAMRVKEFCAALLGNRLQLRRKLLKARDDALHKISRLHRVDILVGDRYQFACKLGWQRSPAR